MNAIGSHLGDGVPDVLVQRKKPGHPVVIPVVMAVAIGNEGRPVMTLHWIPLVKTYGGTMESACSV